MLFCFNLKIIPLCQILSKALYMSQKLFLTSNPLSKDVKIWWVTDRLIKESPGWKRDWFSKMSLLADKKLNISLKVCLSKILSQIGSQ